ncbi:hypothetical protein QBC35DRAFT_388790 [Podospora australis]|uniref:Uncharacterized protein n=1 Tax=Podospora australis TaxID=1536484 RepID=A0AAN6WQA6_9PEZI|nr:hypothetical protein QBC35DRAFT_388790 [Podospora australis]
MKDTTRLRHLAVSLLLTESALAVALPQQIATTAAPAPLPWVTVNPSGSATTITPQVITTEGHISTVSQAPGELLSTVTYTFSSTDNGGGTSTYTGLAPVAQPTDITEPGGVFLACHSDKGNDAPFCLPRSGTTLVAGKSYYSMIPFLQLFSVVLLSSVRSPRVCL